MAELAEPTLLEIIKKHGDSTDPLPAHCFVFGLHFSRHLLTIFIHFPVKITGGEYQFHQFLIAHQSITALPTAFSPYMSEDERFLDRWQLLVALLCIRSNVRDLHHWLGYELSPQMALHGPPIGERMSSDAINLKSSSAK